MFHTYMTFTNSFNIQILYKDWFFSNQFSVSNQEVFVQHCVWLFRKNEGTCKISRSQTIRIGPRTIFNSKSPLNFFFFFQIVIIENNFFGIAFIKFVQYWKISVYSEKKFVSSNVKHFMTFFFQVTRWWIIL